MTSKIIVDSIHGDVTPTDLEWEIIDTPAFQRLRKLKQLGMGHLTYPNATHTRFAHSIGVLATMSRVINVAEKELQLDEMEKENLRMAALLHDVGHYPYSHLMEGIDSIALIDEKIDGKKPGSRQIDLTGSKYPKHEEVGTLIVTGQKGIVDLLTPERAALVAAIFTKSEAADQQRSKLIHSSLDMDRLDYLLRDANAAGVPFGQIDLNYILNNLRLSDSGMIGVSKKAIAAAEHFLFARMFMHRAVYFHKTTFGFEEACRQLLRRCRDSGNYSDLPDDGNAVRGLVKTDQLFSFNDSFVDKIITSALDDSDEVIKTLAGALAFRKPPQLLGEVVEYVLHNKMSEGKCEIFKLKCLHELKGIAENLGIPQGCFLLAEPKPIALENRGSMVKASEASSLKPHDQDELIKVFKDEGSGEPVSLVDFDESILSVVGQYKLKMIRLYLVPPKEIDIVSLREKVKRWVA